MSDERAQSGEVLRGYTIKCTDSEWQCICDAAADAHMQPHDYARLMVLCAAGMGSVLEHVLRAIHASERVDQTTLPIDEYLAQQDLAYDRKERKP